MTAAHCCKSGQNTEVTAVIGAHDLNANDFERIPVVESYIHPDFNITNPSHDIMLLELGEPAENRKNAFWISIPKRNEDMKKGTLCSVAGWGKQTSSGNPSNVLLEAKIKIFNSEVCKAHWPFRNILCAGGLQHGICKGDSGGPLVCNNIAVGIASFFVEPCDAPKKPNGYIKISEFLPWIRDIINKSVGVGIVNGTEAKPHSRPYMVSVQRNGKHVCGGFLVSWKFVMTAAHCWKSGQNTEVTAVIGAHDLNANDFDRIPVVQSYIHPDFNITNPSHDIMLLELGEPAENRKNAFWISIPKRNEDIKEGTLCSVAGWGKQTSSGNPSNVLLEAKIKIFNSEVCKAHWPFRNILCAGGLQHGICEGDSGGPLVCNNIAVGIASFFVKPCDAPKKPNGYIKISEFLPWIKDIITSKK